MNHRMAMLVVFVFLAGCRSGASTVPPPGTGGYQAPNQYYQPSAQPPAFTPPTYGAPGAATAPTINPAPGFSLNQPSFAPRPNVSLASNPQDGLAWQPVTKQPGIATTTTVAQNGSINPRTTLTTIRGTGAPTSATSSATTSNGLRSINDLPMVGVPGAAPPPTSPPINLGLPPATAPMAQPIAAPMFTMPTFAPMPAGGTRYSADPWRGR